MPTRNHRRLIVALAAGATLAVHTGCRRGPTVVAEEPAIGNPSEPETDRHLPDWDEVPSKHPEGATNPPRPVLVVDPDGACFKEWVGSMRAPTPETRDRVQACDAGECGTPIRCPERAAELLEAHRSGTKAD